MSVRCFWVEPTPEGDWVRKDTGETKCYPTSFGPGAMWDDNLHDTYTHFGGYVARLPDDGRIIAVVCPNGCVWVIDSRCGNCTVRDDIHFCWHREGEPPNLTVTAGGRPKCQAGAGSIQAGDYHGFLRDGAFT